VLALDPGTQVPPFIFQCRNSRVLIFPSRDVKEAQAKRNIIDPEAEVREGWIAGPMVSMQSKPNTIHRPPRIRWPVSGLDDAR
jgi:hypothetical protein